MRRDSKKEPERPTIVVRERHPGSIVEPVSVTLKKHGYTCTISGQVQWATAKSRAKAINKWTLTAKNWFWSLVIDDIISEPFVVWELNKEEAEAIRMKSPFYRALERDAELDKIHNRKQ